MLQGFCRSGKIVHESDYVSPTRGRVAAVVPVAAQSIGLESSAVGSADDGQLEHEAARSSMVEWTRIVQFVVGRLEPGIVGMQLVIVELAVWGVSGCSVSDCCGNMYNVLF